MILRHIPHTNVNSRFGMHTAHTLPRPITNNQLRTTESKVFPKFVYTTEVYIIEISLNIRGVLDSVLLRGCLLLV